MTPEEERNLAIHLHAFDATNLGEGDPVAGFNLLAAMAITLGSIARPGSGLSTQSERVLQVGCNLLAAGPHLSELVIDEVVTPLGRAQANLSGNIAGLLDKARLEDARGPARRWSLASARQLSTGESYLLDLMKDEDDLSFDFGGREGMWGRVIDENPVENINHLISHSRFLMTGSTPGQIEAQLPQANQGACLAAIGLNSMDATARLGTLCPALMNGLVSGGPGGERVQARLLVTDHHRVLHDVARAASENTKWLGRLVWLVEGGAGPEVPSLKVENPIARLDRITVRFRQAVSKILANRFESRKGKPLLVTNDALNYQARQADWMRFLMDMEQHAPGISGTARNLFASLVFGSQHLVGATKLPENFQYFIEGIEAFAKLLVLRMANARAAMLFSAEEAQRLRHKQRILERLAAGPLDSRTIYRTLHLSASLCGDLLLELEADRLIQRDGAHWQRLEGAILTSGLNQPPLIA